MAKKSGKRKKPSSDPPSAIPEMPEIRDWYEHQHSPSVFVMFTKNYEAVWSYSGNNLRSFYLRSPEDYISEPLELPIPEYLDRILTDYYDNP